MGLVVDSRYEPLPGVVITLMKRQEEATIVLIENSDYATGLYSVGMDVDDLNATMKALKAEGAKITMDRVPTLVGALAFLEDPNGTRLALIEHH